MEYSEKQIAALRDMVEDWDRVNRLAEKLCRMQGFEPAKVLEYKRGLGVDRKTHDARYPELPDKEIALGALFLPMAARMIELEREA
jgi:hypothetical protein